MSSWEHIGTFPGGPSSPGGCTINDSPGTMEVYVLVPETNPGLTEANLSELDLLYEEVNAALIEAASAEIQVADEPSPTPTETHGVEVRVPDEPNPTPTEVHTQAIAIELGETNPLPSETNTADIKAADEPITLATLARSATVRAGATTVAQTAGTGWQTITNAQGLDNATNATLTSPAGALPPTVTGTLVGTYVTHGTQTTETLSGVVTLTFYCTFNVPLLGFGSLELAHSVNSGTDYTVDQTFTVVAPLGSAAETGPFAFTVSIAINNLAALRFRVTGAVTGALLAGATATLDAVVASYSTIGSAG